MSINKYQKIYMQIKDIIDRMLAAAGAFILAPVFLGIILAIKLEDGLTAPVFFTQKRAGIGKNHFQLYKFRSMRLDTPHDTPTHLLENPDQYITKVGSRLSTKEQKNLKRNGNAAFCGVIFLPVYRFCPYYGYQHV